MSLLQVDNYPELPRRVPRRLGWLHALHTGRRRGRIEGERSRRHRRRQDEVIDTHEHCRRLVAGVHNGAGPAPPGASSQRLVDQAVADFDDLIRGCYGLAEAERRLLRS